LQLDAYPVNIFLDHNMNVINITESEMNQTAVNDIIESMLDDIPAGINYLDDIQPIFDANCTSCHGSAAGLNLTSYSNLMNGSNDGDVITPLNHSNSILWQEIDLGSMPPGSNDNLSSSQINLIAQWIDAGACESGNDLPDQCGTCDDNPSNDCIQDCNGDWGGTLEEDECGVCGGNNSTCMDCAEIPNGDSLVDECGACDNDSSNDCIQDCNGDWGGIALFDDCSVPVCSGGETGLVPNDSCTDCNGEINGSSYIDGCGSCVGGNTGIEPCISDCAGVDGGDAERNECETCICNSSVAQEGFECLESEICVSGCDGFWYNDGLEPVLDECSICGGDNSTCSDCADVPFGDSLEDECGTCDNDSSNDCVQDCNGDWGGSLVEDECGVCGGDSSSCLFVDRVIPENFSINNIYPNPFNPVVNIEYSLITSGLVNINIFDLNGQLVDRLFTGNQVVGEHSISWDASGMSSSIYIIMIQSGNIMLTDQLILIK
jgi:mono/diheme cytochrome c family protein